MNTYDYYLTPQGHLYRHSEGMKYAQVLQGRSWHDSMVTQRSLMLMGISESSARKQFPDMP